VRRLRGRPAPWNPLAWLVTAYVVLIWFAVFPDLGTPLDVPDVVTTFALLGADALVRYVLPCLLLAFLLRGVGYLWRIGKASSVVAQRIGVPAGCLGLLSITLSIGLAAVDLEPKTLDVAVDEFASALDVDGVEGKRRVYAAMSLGLGSGLSSGQASASQGAGAFGACAEALSGPVSDRRAVVEEATRFLMRRGMDKADAEDLVMDTLLRVCLRHADEPRRDLIPYFWRALQNKASTFYGRAYRRDVPWDDGLFGDDLDLPADVRLALEGDLATLRAALARLSPADRYVLMLRHVDGLSHGDIAARLGKGEAAVRQQVKRARDRLEQAWRHEERRR
jgi:RNA polymerase sigma factor (sigma-70 family)